MRFVGMLLIGEPRGAFTVRHVGEPTALHTSEDDQLNPALSWTSSMIPIPKCILVGIHIRTQRE